MLKIHKPNVLFIIIESVGTHPAGELVLSFGGVGKVRIFDPLESQYLLYDFPLSEITDDQLNGFADNAAFQAYFDSINQVVVVSNTEDLEKPVSNPQAAAIQASQDFAIQRSNHTGTQSVSTITGLATVATSGSHADLSDIGTNTHTQLDSHVASTSNPHSVTKSQVGLPNVDNTADADKPISTATQSALDLKYDTSNPSGYQTSAQVASAVNVHASLTNNPHGVTKSQVGLANVDNTSDVDKPVSTAQATADSAVQAFAIQRANHTGTQAAATISDFASTVLGTILTGLSLASGAAVTAADSILIAIGKLQQQLNLKVWGNNYQIGSNNTPFTTTSQAGYATNTLTTVAHSFTTSVVPAGTYRIGVKTNLFMAAVNSSFKHQWFVDGTAQTLMQEMELSDTTNDQTFTNFIHYTLASPAAITIELRVATEAAALLTVTGSAYEFWRVA